MERSYPPIDPACKEALKASLKEVMSQEKKWVVEQINSSNDPDQILYKWMEGAMKEAIRDLLVGVHAEFLESLKNKTTDRPGQLSSVNPDKRKENGNLNDYQSPDQEVVNKGLWIAPNQAKTIRTQGVISQQISNNWDDSKTSVCLLEKLPYFGRDIQALSLAGEKLTAIDFETKMSQFNTILKTTSAMSPTRLKCPRCIKDFVIYAMFTVDDDLSVIVVKCDCRLQGRVTNSECLKLAVLRENLAVVVGLLDKPVSIYKSKKRSQQDSVWRDQHRLVFREFGSQLLIEYQLDDLRQPPNHDRIFNKGRYSQVPNSMEAEPVEHAWLHFNSNQLAILWQDGRFFVPSTREGQQVVSPPLSAGVKWQMIRQVFPTRYLMCGTHQQKAVVHLVDSRIRDSISTVLLPLVQEASWPHISMIIEVRRSTDKVMLLALDRISLAHLLLVTKEVISVFKAGVNICDFHYAVVADSRHDGQTDIYIGGYETAIKEGSLKKLTIKFSE